MDILEFLPHYLIVQNRLWVRAFLPHLMTLGLLLVGGTVVGKLVEQPFPALFAKLGENCLRGEFLEAGERFRQVRPGEDGVEMVFHDHPAMDFQCPMFPAVFQRAEQGVATSRTGEDGQPLHDGGGNEVRGLRFKHSVAAAHSARLSRRESR